MTDDKAAVRGALDLTSVEWIRAEPDDKQDRVRGAQDGEFGSFTDSHGSHPLDCRAVIGPGVSRAAAVSS